MAGIIARQPNGLFCRHSSDTESVSHYNMTEEEYIHMKRDEGAEKAEQEAREILKYYVRDFEAITDLFVPGNMTEERFQEILKEMERPAEQCKPVIPE